MPWYRRKLDTRFRAILGVIGVSLVALGLFTNGTTSLLVQLALLIAFTVVLVVAVRQSPSEAK
jgi:hypothetical protein